MKKLLILCLAIGAGEAFAIPSGFTSDCGALTGINNQTNSTLVRDHKSCQKVWVLPPTSGRANLSHFTAGGNLGFCKTMKSLQSSTYRIVERMKRYTVEIDAMTPGLNHARKKLMKERKKAAKYEAEHKEALSQMRSLTSHLEGLEMQIEKNTELSMNCGSDAELCERLHEEYRSLKLERRSTYVELREFRSEHHDIVRSFEKAQRKVELAQQNLNTVLEVIQLKETEQLKLLTLVQGAYQTYANMEGGFAHIDYDSGWEQNVKWLENRYPQYQFEMIRTKGARIHAQLTGATNKAAFLSSLSSILDYTIQGLNYLPYGDAPSENVHASLPSHLVGAIRLSLVGACPLYYKDFLDEGDILTANPNVSTNVVFGITASYQYPVNYRFNMTASYNLYKFYQRMVTSKSKSRFFSRKNWTEISETNLKKDSFFINWEVEDPDSTFSSKQRMSMQKEIKQDLMSRVLTMAAEPVSVPAAADVEPLPIPVTNGAMIFAHGVSQTCGSMSIWCKGISWALKGVAGSFGSASSATNYMSKQDYTAEEKWGVNQSTWIGGTTTFLNK
ncbi:MAG: hypothetical protein HOE90_03110 [Bacteriovoracaceae bacterium]|jgi:hypothetical protein|nr:hypothetical protein [Bacteriovoracaceae bacterium]